MDSATIKVIIADDQTMIRHGLRLIIDHEPGFEVVSEADNGQQAIDEARRWRPDVILMDIRMPQVDGIAATEVIRRDPSLASTKVLVLTTFKDDEYVVRALRAGASGFLLKDAEPGELLDAIRQVVDGRAPLDPSVTPAVIAGFLAHADAARPVRSDAAAKALATLSEREREIWHLVAEGHSNREIAADLFISEATVKTHMSSLMSKLGVDSRVQAVVLAYEVGLVNPGERT